MANEESKTVAAEPEPTREERAAALLAEFEHAMVHNAPITAPMMAELRELLGDNLRSLPPSMA